MGYLQDADRWLDSLFADLADGRIDFAETKRSIRERILESYKNGLRATGQPPAPRESRPPRRFEPRRNQR
jgi:hypothetical protein